MAPTHSLDPHFTPGTRLSRLPVRTEPEGLEEFCRDLFAGAGPEHDRERLLRLLDEDVVDGVAAQGRSGAMDHLDRAFRRIDAWTLQGDYLPQADRAELKRRVAHNLLATRPGLHLAAEGAGPDRGILRQVQAEHAAWRHGWSVDSPDGQRTRLPWDEQPSRQPRQPWDERPDSPRPDQPWNEQAPRQGRELADALRLLGRGEPLNLAAGPDRDASRRQEDPKTYWFVTPKPAACAKCLAMAGRLYLEAPERPHPNCKCRIESRELTKQQAAALQDDLARRAEALNAEHDRLEREKQAAKARPKAPAYVDDSQWSKNGDPMTVTGKDKKGAPVRQTFKGHVLPHKTKGGVAIKIKDDKQIDRRVTKEMSDTLQEVLDDPRCKKAGITEVTISSTTDGQHNGPENRHYQGKAVDISKINGKSIRDDATAAKQAVVMQEVIKEKAKELKIKDNLGPTYMDMYTSPGFVYDKSAKENHKNHVHIAII